MQAVAQAHNTPQHAVVREMPFLLARFGTRIAIIRVRPICVAVDAGPRQIQQTSAAINNRLDQFTEKQLNGAVPASLAFLMLR